jgi:integrase
MTEGIWGHPKGQKTKMPDVPSRGELITKLNSIYDLRDKTLCSIAYLTAGRVREILSIYKGDITKTKRYGHEWLMINMEREKVTDKKFHRKIIPINIEKEKDFVKPILEYLEIYKGDKLFNITPQRAWQLIKRYFGFHPHFFRHIRLTHLVTVYDFSEQELMQYAGWTTSNPSKYYIQLKYTDLMKKLG